MANPEKKFEVALQDLEDIVSKLESGELPLEESLGLFEKGISLSQLCTQKLSEAEKRVEVLLQELSKEDPPTKPTTRDA